MEVMLVQANPERQSLLYFSEKATRANQKSEHPPSPMSSVTRIYCCEKEQQTVLTTTVSWHGQLGYGLNFTGCRWLANKTGLTSIESGG
jgi:hypothetical protein